MKNRQVLKPFEFSSDEYDAALESGRQNRKKERKNEDHTSRIELVSATNVQYFSGSGGDTTGKEVESVKRGRDHRDLAGKQHSGISD